MLCHRRKRHFEQLLPIEQLEQECRDDNDIDPAALIAEDESDIDQTD